jgi:NAD(P)-dependent dehydrogenase (short-subunit alcohol dehydrogenase family)
MFQLDLLKGKRILVTGGGTGLGRSMSHRFLELGANVVICGRREDVLEQTAEELTKETGAEIETVRCDVRLPDAVEAMMDRIWQTRPLDILVNNAAGQILAPTHKMSSRAIDAVLGIVLHGSAYCTVAAGRRWIDAGERNKVVMSILTVSALTEGAWSRLMPKERGGEEELVKTIPLRRVGEHIELANLAAFLVSDGAAYINGDAVVIDGGKMQSGGGGASTQSMLDWTDVQWEASRPKKK